MPTVGSWYPWKDRHQADRHLDVAVTESQDNRGDSSVREKQNGTDGRSSAMRHLIGSTTSVLTSLYREDCP